jgi:hypothetical protein
MSCSTAREESEEFTSARAEQIMVIACRSAGLSPHGARLIRLGENALFRLDRHPVIVRIARSADYLDAARVEVRVSRWPAEQTRQPSLSAPTLPLTDRESSDSPARPRRPVSVRP